MKRFFFPALFILVFAIVYSCHKTGVDNPSTSDSASTDTTATVDCSSSTTTAAIVVCKANAFMATLSSSQLDGVLFDYTKENAIKWSNLPCGSQCRIGLEMSTLTSAQVAAALAVVQAATGTAANEGYAEIKQIMAADDILGQSANGYSSGNYFISFLGTPSLTGTWQLQFGGHHLATNITFEDGEVVSATPKFEGIEPKTWTSNDTTYAPISQEHDAMVAMLGSLSAVQLTSAKLSSTFSDVVLGPNADGQFPSAKAGLAVNSLSSAQQALVMAAMKPWTQDADDAMSASLLSTYQNELSGTYIAYSGNTTLANQADYVRIDGPSVWIEFVCQNGVVYQNQIHYHSVWRDHTRDYGGNFTF